MNNQGALFLNLSPLLIALLGIILAIIGYASQDDSLQMVGFGFVSVGTFIGLFIYAWMIFSD